MTRLKHNAMQMIFSLSAHKSKIYLSKHLGIAPLLLLLRGNLSFDKKQQECNPV